MALQLIQPRDKYLMKTGTIDRRAILGHLRDVLKSFASKPEYGSFYIGITSDFEVRFLQHQQKKPQFKWMIPIYEEPVAHILDSFDALEREAIMEFRGGIKHPVTKQILLRCENEMGGAPPKTVLYVLVG